VILAYLAMRDAELRPTPQVDRPRTVRAVVENLGEGARFVRSTPIVLLAVTVVGLVATFGMNFSVLIPPLADNVLHVGASGYGFLMAASGVGSTVAALAVAFSRRPSPTVIATGAIALGIGSIALAASTVFPLSLLAMVIAGAGGIGMAVTANTTIQLSVPDHLRGRVMSVYTTVFSGSVPAGGLLMGAIGSAWGVPISLMIGAVLSLLCGLGAWVWVRRIQPATRPVRRATVASAEIGAIDPDGRSAGMASSARPR